MSSSIIVYINRPSYCTTKVNKAFERNSSRVLYTQEPREKHDLKMLNYVKSLYSYLLYFWNGLQKYSQFMFIWYRIRSVDNFCDTINSGIIPKGKLLFF